MKTVFRQSLSVFVILGFLLLGGMESGCVAKPKLSPESQATPHPGFLTRTQRSLFKFLPKPKHPPKASKPLFIGTVAMVSEQDRFVLIDISSFSNVPAGMEVFAIGDGITRAQLKISAEKKHPFVIADILNGDPVVGDRVFQLTD